MRSFVVRLLAAAAVLPVAAAPSSSQTLAEDDPVLRQIWDVAVNRSRLEPLAQALLDSIGPRLTASPGMERAQDWAVKMLSSWGYEARTERYGTWEGWDRGPSHVDLVSPRVRSLEGRILAWSPGTDGRPVEAPVTYLPTIGSPADWESFLGTVRGKWVMMSFPQPTCRTDAQWREFAMQGSFERMDSARDAAQDAWTESLRATGSEDTRGRDLYRALEAAGAAGVITSQWTGAYGTTRVFNAYTREVPTFELGCEDYGLVYRLAANGQGPVLRLTAESRNLGEVPVFNVLASKRGTELPEEYVMLSAHFDSWEGGSGATDNGTGSVLMMEAMRILAEAYPNPRRTILIGLWSGEEQGLNGSHAFVEDHPEVVDGLQALFNQDNGTGRVVSMSASGFPDASGSLARWLARVPAEVSTFIEPNFPGMPSGGGTDSSSFVCIGAPGFSLGALNWGYFDHTWHTQRDTYDKLVFDDLRNNAVLVASLVYLASEDPERVSRERRTTFPVNRFTGEQGSWPTCSPAQRTS
ncbi:MAG TPA: M20/M25/M40 family metallo-hydrolase, partial [Longimicrobiales bacterium]|nr:M20/M25/M40 family metallo-hydrolase [Longimicrobiales bacterium]